MGLFRGPPYPPLSDAQAEPNENVPWRGSSLRLKTSPVLPNPTIELSGEKILAAIRTKEKDRILFCGMD